jgi:hypothetical protein
MAEFNIRDLFQSAFGYEPPAEFAIPNSPGRKETSRLGAPMYTTDSFGREFFLPVKLNGYLLPFAIISIAAKNLIVSTVLPERPGSVKEFITAEDYAINIKGIIIRPDNQFPEEELIELERLRTINQAMTLECALTDVFLKGTYQQKVVLRSMSFPAVAGIEHSKPYEIELESDQVYELEIT